MSTSATKLRERPAGARPQHLPPPIFQTPEAVEESAVEDAKSHPGKVLLTILLLPIMGLRKVGVWLLLLVARLVLLLTPVFNLAMRPFKRLARGMMVRMPVPSEVKWNHTLQFVGNLTLGYYRDLKTTMPAHDAELIVAKGLSESGRRWMWEMMSARGGELKSLTELADMMNVSFRAMDIQSTVEVSPHQVKVTNWHCPYVARAPREQVHKEVVCQMMCGARTSLFQGVNHGLPMHIQYRPETMMGKGDKACVKRYTDVLKKLK
ncbi:MAG: hypothetical protein FJ039_01410 [Chloroflexi bacterium]|nr:hypothetical protein [Chloroflexota bacterium]